MAYYHGYEWIQFTTTWLPRMLVVPIYSMFYQFRNYREMKLPRQYIILPSGVPAFFNYATDWDSYYPDMHSVYIINTPRLFESILRVVRSLISEKTNIAFKAYGANRLEWSSALLEFIDADQLRPAFGGTKRV